VIFTLGRHRFCVYWYRLWRTRPKYVFAYREKSTLWVNYVLVLGPLLLSWVYDL
jgi:hypothetical protein